ncbi:MAG: DNA translocase FtsK, partial [Patescibacteria group bacterium]|nr:DNA translocase FtsK [Patescibacteria group bacterium]
ALLGVAGHVAWPEKFEIKTTTKIGAALLPFAWGGLLGIILLRTPEAMTAFDNWPRAGGFFGCLLGCPLTAYAGLGGGTTVLVALTLAAIVLAFNVSLRAAWSKLNLIRASHDWRWPMLFRSKAAASSSTVEEESRPEFRKRPLDTVAPNDADADDTSGDAPKIHDYTPPVPRHRLPRVSIPLDLLANLQDKPTAGDINGRLMTIKKTLENFGIPSEMGEVSVGPTVTQFTLKPADGIKLARITSLSNDLALSLAAHPIRIEAPIPGKSLVGIEVPNQTVAVVGLREVLETKQFRERKSTLTVCLGKDVSGKPWIADLGKMPHMLVAGATGSGKTVCLNALILSLLYQNGPEDLRLMLIDPKRVELPVYNGIAHLLTPAITEVPKIINALKWAIGEMDRRFEILSQSGKRDIGAYNEDADEKLPYIVIIIDELADLMVASASEVEASIIRLAQMARAVGIHLVVATQRPSVDVITGLIKANITTRIAFSVASATDSRTILDSTGAEKLVGRGDMLFQTPELSKPKRIQCCYVSDHDIKKVVDFIVSQQTEPADYVDGVTEKPNGNHAAYGFGYDADGDDELLEEAKQTVIKAGKASASYLQRRLKIGYARAARLLDLLEERGIIGPGDGAKPRQVLASVVHDVDGAHVVEKDDFDENDSSQA